MWTIAWAFEVPSLEKTGGRPLMLPLAVIHAIDRNWERSAISKRFFHCLLAVGRWNAFLRTFRCSLNHGDKLVIFSGWDNSHTVKNEDNGIVTAYLLRLSMD